MGHIRPCSFCGGAHRKRSAAQRCYRKNQKATPWRASDFGGVSRKK